MPTTPLGVIDYPAEGDTDWYDSSDGLEEWLARAELLGIPTYETFADLPDPSTTKVVNPGSGQDQRQFAAVKGDLTVYRSDGSSWVAWMNLYTDSEAVSAIEDQASIDVDITGDADTVDGEHASAFADSGHSHAHGDLTSVGSDDHHSQTHDNADHSTNYLAESDYTPESDTHSKYTDSEAVAAVEADSPLDLDITGDADTVDGYQAAAFARVAADMSIDGSWTFNADQTIEARLTAIGTSATEDSGDGIIAVRPWPDDNTRDAHFRWMASDGGPRATFMYDQADSNLRIWDYVNGENKVIHPIHAAGAATRFPQGIEVGGSPSSSGTPVLDETQVTSTTNNDGNYELTVQGDTYEFIPQ